MKRTMCTNDVADRLSFLPDRLRDTAALMFTSPRRAAAWIGMMTSEEIELAAKHQPTQEHVERLKEIYHEIFPDFDIEDGTRRILPGFQMMYSVMDVCTHSYRQC